MTAERAGQSRRRRRPSTEDTEAAEVASTTAPTGEVRRMEDVIGALLRTQTRAVVFTHLGEYVLTHFGVGDAGPPKLLLRLPGGGPFPADPEYLIDLSNELRHLASSERAKAARILASYATPAAKDVDPVAVPSGPDFPARPGEGIEDVSSARASVNSSRTRARE
jgi:hypothetical protein